MPKTPVSFRLSEKAIENLDKMAEEKGGDKTSIIENLLMQKPKPLDLEQEKPQETLDPIEKHVLDMLKLPVIRSAIRQFLVSYTVILKQNNFRFTEFTITPKKKPRRFLFWK